MTSGRIHVGISGWSYPRWRGDFYPDGLVQRSELAYAAERLDSIELNASFYSLRRPELYRGWAEQLPPGQPMALKGPRFVTHMKKLHDPLQGLANFFASGVLALGEHLGPVLWQLPETVAFDEARVAAFLDLLPRSSGAAAELAGRHDDKVPADRALSSCEVDVPLRHALEPRSASFAEPTAVALLTDRQVATVWSDSAGRWPELDLDTADFRYVRLHGHDRLYASDYGPELLQEWAGRCRGWARSQDVYVYFDNDAAGHAPWNACDLRALLGGDPAAEVRPRPTSR